MGSSLQRLEILLIGLVVLLAGAVAAVLTLVRPISPVADGGMRPPAVRATVVPTGVAALPSAPTVQPTRGGAPTPVVAPTVEASGPSTPLIPRVALPSVTTGAVFPSAKMAWPWLLVGVGLAGTGLATLRFRRRRMTYIGQSVGQLLGAADTTTRASNIRVMRELADQGLLTAELAAAAGIPLPRGSQGRRRLRLPSVRLPRLRWPSLTLPALRVSRLFVPSWSRPWSRLLTIWRAIIQARRSPTAAPAVLAGADPLPPESLAVQAAEPALLTALAGDTTQEVWSADDRAQVVAAALAAIWKQSGLSSSVLALDTETGDGSGQVAVMIDAAAADDAALAELPQRLAARTPSWHTNWRGSALVVDVPTSVVSAPGGPLLLPPITYGRGGRTTRYVPLTWGGSQPTPTRHLGLYGAQALGALHAALGSLLYAQPPTALALAILDQGEIAPLYRTAPHRVDLPEGGAAAVDTLARALRRVPRRADVRPLLLVVVEPDASVLLALDALLPRLRQQPDAPLHLLIVQERLRPEGRELYAVLPALITAGGQGPTNWLPGQNGWPRTGARLAGHQIQVEGRAPALDEAAIAALVTGLGAIAGELPPVLWDAPPTALVDAPGAAPAAEASADLPEPEALPFGAVGQEQAARKARLAAALAGEAGLMQDHQDAIVPARQANPMLEQQPADPVDTGWPHGPLDLTPKALAALLAHIVSDAAFTTAPQPDQIGVTKRRLQSAGLKLALFPEPQARPLAEALMVWFDAAGILADPAHPHDHRLNQPRALGTTDLAQIAERLRAAPLPTFEAARAAFASSAGGVS